MNFSNVFFFILLFGAFKAMHLNLAMSAKTFTEDPCPGIEPSEGCVFVWRTYKSKIQICDNYNDLRNLDFDKSIVAVKLSNNSKVTLWDSYDYSGNFISFKDLGFYRLPDEFTCKTSSIQFYSSQQPVEIDPDLLIRGYIKNGVTNNVFSASDLTNDSITIIFSDEEADYPATIFPSNSTYYVKLPTGRYIRNVGMQNYVSSSVSIDFETNLNESSASTTIFIVPAFSGWRAVLTWGELDKDLDAYLKLPNEEIVYYRKKKSFDGSTTLDVDSRSFGPETVTLSLNSSLSGIYKFYAKSYSKQVPLTQSEAKVIVYQGNTQVSEIHIPTTSNIDNQIYWNAFNLEAVGENQNYIESNEIKDRMS